MILCEHDCKPHCDFCYYSIHDFFKTNNGRIIKGEPIGCQLHTEEEYPAYCDDFYCMNAYFKNTQELREKEKMKRSVAITED